MNFEYIELENKQGKMIEDEEKKKAKIWVCWFLFVAVVLNIVVIYLKFYKYFAMYVSFLAGFWAHDITSTSSQGAHCLYMVHHTNTVGRKK